MEVQVNPIVYPKTRFYIYICFNEDNTFLLDHVAFMTMQICWKKKSKGWLYLENTKYYAWPKTYLLFSFFYCQPRLPVVMWQCNKWNAGYVTYQVSFPQLQGLTSPSMVIFSFSLGTLREEGAICTKMKCNERSLWLLPLSSSLLFNSFSLLCETNKMLKGVFMSVRHGKVAQTELEEKEKHALLYIVRDSGAYFSRQS